MRAALGAFDQHLYCWQQEGLSTHVDPADPNVLLLEGLSEMSLQAGVLPPLLALPPLSALPPLLSSPRERHLAPLNPDPPFAPIIKAFPATPRGPGQQA